MLANEPRTLVFYESSHRIQDCLVDLRSAFGDARGAAVCRELTKQFESFYGGTLAEVAEAIDQHPDHRRGEFVVMVAGAEVDGDVALMDAVALATQLAAA